MEVTPAEREAEGLARRRKAFETLCPRILDNPFIPHTPLPAQALFLGSHQASAWRDGSRKKVFRALYGGAAGGGKSDALLMGAAQYAWSNPAFAGICFRRTFVDLAMPGALLDRAHEWWTPRGVGWRADTKTFIFPGGGKVVFAYMQAPNDHLKYQGSNYHYAAFDELTQWPDEKQYEYVGVSRVRRKSRAEEHLPLRTLAASNPGGPGHNWVKTLFVGGVNMETGLSQPPRFLYIPARIADNPFLDQEAYIEGLMDMHPTVRQQLLDGDWSAREPGDYFRAEWFGPLLDPETDIWPAADCVRIRWWDLAASEKADAKFTAGVRMARHRAGVRAIEHCRSFKATPGKRDDLIIQTAQADGYGVIVGLEIEGGSGGPAQFEALKNRLEAKGFRVAGAKPKAELTDREGKVMLRNPVSDTGKQARADPVASCLERGYQRRGEAPLSDLNRMSPWRNEDVGKPVRSQRDGIRLFAGPWTQGYLDVVEGFPEGPTCDEVDATSGAWAWLEVHTAGLIETLPIETRHTIAEQHNLHPTERDDNDDDDGRNPLPGWRRRVARPL